MQGFNRRTFLKTSSLAVAGAAISRRNMYASVLSDVVATQDFRLLASAAFEAAKGVGASYADIHFRIYRRERWGSFQGTSYSAPILTTDVGVSIRSLVNGYWGFAGMDGIATLDDAARLGRNATGQAKIVANKGRARSVDLAVLSSVANGSWTMPVEIDPFTVPFEEKADFFTAMNDFIQRQCYGVRTQYDMSAQLGPLSFIKEERVFASTEGAYTTQTVYTTSGANAVVTTQDWLKAEVGSRSIQFLTPAGAGWEYIRKAPFQDQAASIIAEAFRSRRKKPVNIGRYDIVFDARALAGILSLTIGGATELDRAMGYLANDAGTSYLTDPEEMLGTFKMGSPMLNVTANRSMPGGAATVKWDDEGVEPSEINLVKNGILNDLQTTRESASWIAPYYQKNGSPVQSNGCAGIYNQTSTITQVNPNFVLAPATSSISMDDMVKDTKKGLLVLGGYTNTDQQLLNGDGSGEIVYEIIDGKIGSSIAGAEYLYRSPDFWKNLVALGGSSTIGKYGFTRSRSSGTAMHTVLCVPGKVTGVAVTDYMRKA